MLQRYRYQIDFFVGFIKIAAVFTILESSRIIAATFDYGILMSKAQHLVPITTVCMVYVGIFIGVITSAMSFISVLLSQAIARDSRDLVKTLVVVAVIIAVVYVIVFLLYTLTSNRIESLIIPNKEMMLYVKVYSICLIGYLFACAINMVFATIMLSLNRIKMVSIISLVSTASTCMLDYIVITYVNDDIYKIAGLSLSLSFGNLLFTLLSYLTFIRGFLEEGHVLRSRITLFIKLILQSGLIFAALSIVQGVSVNFYMKYSFINGEAANFAYSSLYRPLTLLLMFFVGASRAGSVGMSRARELNDVKLLNTSVTVMTVTCVGIAMIAALFTSIFKGGCLGLLGITMTSVSPQEYKYSLELMSLAPIFWLVAAIETTGCFILISIKDKGMHFIVAALFYVTCIPLAFYINTSWDSGVSVMVPVFTASAISGIWFWWLALGTLAKTKQAMGYGSMG